MASAVLLVSCISEKPLQTDIVEPEAEASAYISGEAYVKFSDEMVRVIEEDLTGGNLVTRSAGLNQSLEALGITSISRVFSHGGEYEPRRRAAGLHKWYHITYAPTVPQTKAANDLSMIAGVETVEPVRKIAISSGLSFNDWTSDLWGLYNTKNEGIDINVKPVWENYTVGNSNVIVAVVDSGVEVKHPDLAANCTSTHYNCVSGGAIAPEDHGTHVAGTIAAVGNNGKGICGIAGGDAAAGKPGVKITSYQIFAGDSQASGTAAIADAADDGAVICQNSWGYQADTDGDGKISNEELKVAMNATLSSVEKAAIDYFIDNAGCNPDGTQRADSPMKGGLVVFAAGNDAVGNAVPANYERVIAVGAIGSDGRRASFSNYGSWVDIAAPGVEILSTVTGGGYATMNGTSMACPHVSGVAALVLSYCGGQGFTAEMLKEKILNGANRNVIPASDNIGPLLDAYGALTYGDGVVPDPIDDLVLTGRGDNIDLSWTQKGDSQDKPVYGALVIYGKDKDAVTAATPQSYNGCGTFAYEIGLQIGEKVSMSVSGLEFETVYYCKVLNYTYGMTYSDPTEVYTVTTTENNAPVVTLDYDGEISLSAHNSLTVALQISEPDDHTFTVAYTPGSEADALTKSLTGKYSIVITGNAAPAGSYTGKVTVTDQHGKSAVLNVPYTLRDNAAPVILKEIEDVFLKSKAAEFQIDMSEYVSDPDGEQLRYDIEIADPQVFFLNADMNLLYGTPLKYGTSDVVVTAYDARNEKAVFEFKVLIKDPSRPVSVYPNPVTDFVNIGTMDMAETSVRITGSTGKLMYEGSMQVSGLEPARIDMSGYAPGTYTVKVSFGGNEYIQNVVKL